jgi:phosphatidate cytidylyltransferase
MDRVNLMQRVMTALLLAPLLLGVVAFAPSGLFALVLGLVFMVGALEWGRLAGCTGRAACVAFAALFVASCAALWAARAALPLAGDTVLAVGLAWWVLAGAWILGRWTLPRSLKLLGGLTTLVPAWWALVVTHDMARGPWLVFGLLFIVWAADVGAYFAGHRFGRHKLAPQVSPGKTWEGVAGGVVLASLVAAVVASLLELALPALVLLALGVVTISIVGDLMESLLKRQVGAKDSGVILPGHGGVLDRFDSLFAAAPLWLVGLSVLGLSA